MYHSHMHTQAGSASSSTPAPTPSLGAAKMLANQFKEMQKAKDLPGISCGLVGENVFEWEVMLMISDDCKYYGGESPRSLVYCTTDGPMGSIVGYKRKTILTECNKTGANFSARLSFPPTNPLLPPTMTFVGIIPFHPNVYPNGKVCISILHPPEDDEFGYETAAERWSPVQTPETILLSVISLLHGPNDESPANVEAARLWREEQKEFRRRCRQCVRESLGEE
jgi:ubiquitin-conjugating enzyme E2 G1